MSSQCFGGRDVAKAHLDVALRPTGARWEVPKDDAGIATLVTRLQEMAPPLMVLTRCVPCCSERAVPDQKNTPARAF